jgi:3-oxoacyl-(acyl-carrier-protein) synthase
MNKKSGIDLEGVDPEDLHIILRDDLTPEEEERFVDEFARMAVAAARILLREEGCQKPKDE